MLWQDSAPRRYTLENHTIQSWKSPPRNPSCFKQAYNLMVGHMDQCRNVPVIPLHCFRSLWRLVLPGSCPHHVLLPTHRASEVPCVPTDWSSAAASDVWPPSGWYWVQVQNPQDKAQAAGEGHLQPLSQVPTGAAISPSVQPLTGFGASCLLE